MRFEWDEKKRRSNLKRHGFDFIDVGKVFAGEVLTVLDDRYDYGETRFFTLGLCSLERSWQLPIPKQTTLAE